jgi:diguanylate cyclase (GGDEF)-like protein
VRIEVTREGEKYVFSNTILREYIYGAMDENTKRSYHRFAAQALIRSAETKNAVKAEMNKNKRVYDEIIFQLENAGMIDETLLRYRLANAERLAAVADYEKAIENYEKAMEQLGETPEIHLEIAKIYTLSGMMLQNKPHFKRASELAIQSGDLKLRAKILGECLFRSYSDVLFEAKKLFEENPQLQQDCLDYYVMMLREDAYTLDGNIDEKSVLLKRAVQLCPPHRPDIKGRILLTWGFLCHSAARLEDARKLWLEAKENYLITNDAYGLAAVASNLGEIKLAHNDIEGAKALLFESLEIAKKHRLTSVLEHVQEVLLNCYMKGMEYENATELALEIINLERMRSTPTRRQVFAPYMFMDKYRDAYKLAKVLDNLEGKMGIAEFGEFFNVQVLYWSNRARLAIYLGNDSWVSVFLAHEAKECEGREISDYIPFLYVPFYDAILAMEEQNGDKVNEAYLKIKAFAELHPKRQDILNLLCEFLLLLHNGGGLQYIGQSELQEMTKKLGRIKLAPIVAAKFGFLKALTQTCEDRLATLMQARQAAKSAEQPLTLALLCAAISQHYKGENYYLSMYYHAEGCRVVKKLLDDVPPEFAQSFIQRHNLQALIYNDELFAKMLSDENLRVSARKTHFAGLEGIESFADVVVKMSGDAEKNLELIAKYMAAVTYATSCKIVAQDSDGEFTVLASSDGRTELEADRQILSRAQIYEAETLVTGSEEGTDETVMCFPIVFDGEVHGIVYIYTDSIIHNFSSDTFNECKRFTKLLATNINTLLIKISSTIDRLTGALNRKAFDQELHRKIERAAITGHVFSIIMTDLDRFKSINDTYGHQTGDDVLRAMGRLLSTKLKKGEIFGRYGGEEFIIIADEGPEEALKLAERLRISLDDAKLLGSKRPVTGSFGVATFGIHDTTKEGLIEKADKALYICKEQGRNRSMIYSPEHMESVKTANIAGGIVTGDTVKDGRRMRGILDLIELTGRDLYFKEKVELMLTKIMDMMEAGSIALLVLNDGEVSSEIRPSSSEDIYHGQDHNTQKSTLKIPITVDGIEKYALFLSADKTKKEYKPNDAIFATYLTGFIKAIAKTYSR